MNKQNIPLCARELGLIAHRTSNKEGYKSGKFKLYADRSGAFGVEREVGEQYSRTFIDYNFQGESKLTELLEDKEIRCYDEIGFDEHTLFLDSLFRLIKSYNDLHSQVVNLEISHLNTYKLKTIQGEIEEFNFIELERRVKRI